MLFKVASVLLPIIAITQGAFATAIAARGTAEAVAVPFAQPLVSSGKNTPVVDPSSTLKTTPKSNVADLQPAPGDAELFVCTGTGCSGTCTTIDVSQLVENVCFQSISSFTSGTLVLTNGNSTGFNTFVAQASCANSVQIPSVNTCFNFLVGGKAATFTNLFITP